MTAHMPWPTRECHPFVAWRDSPPWVMLWAPCPPPPAMAPELAPTAPLISNPMHQEHNAKVPRQPRRRTVELCCKREGERRCPSKTFSPARPVLPVMPKTKQIYMYIVLDLGCYIMVYSGKFVILSSYSAHYIIHCTVTGLRFII